MADNIDPPPSSEEEKYDGLEEGQEGQDEEERGAEEDQDEEEGEEEEDLDEDEDDEEYHGRRAVVLFPPNQPKEEVMKFYKDALDAKDVQEENIDGGHYLSFYVPGFSFNNSPNYYVHEITRVLFNVKDENGNDMPYYESSDARSKRGFHCWSYLRSLAKTAGMTLEDDGLTMRDKYLNTWTLVGSLYTPEGSIEGEKEEENDEEDGKYDSENDYNQVYNKSEEEEDVGPDPEGTYNDDSDSGA